jgi:hypothetical protein
LPATPEVTASETASRKGLENIVATVTDKETKEIRVETAPNDNYQYKLYTVNALIAELKSKGVNYTLPNLRSLLLDPSKKLAVVAAKEEIYKHGAAKFYLFLLPKESIDYLVMLQTGQTNDEDTAQIQRRTAAYEAIQQLDVIHAGELYQMLDFLTTNNKYDRFRDKLYAKLQQGKDYLSQHRVSGFVVNDEFITALNQLLQHRDIELRYTREIIHDYLLDVRKNEAKEQSQSL